MKLNTASLIITIAVAFVISPIGFSASARDLEKAESDLQNAGAAIFELPTLLRGYVGYTAMAYCNGKFVSGRSEKSVKEEELGIGRPAILKDILVPTWSDNRVTVGHFRTNKKTAMFVPGLGCILEQPGYDIAAFQRIEQIRSKEQPAPTPDARLADAMRWAFEAKPAWRTRAVVVVRDGKLLGERYADGYNRDMLQTGWSMAKSVTNALFGIALREKLIPGVSDAHVRAEWCIQPQDERCSITIDQLLRMISGLEFNESYGLGADDVLPMLSLNGDMAAYATNKPLKYHGLKKYFYYSSGTSNILAAYLKEHLAEHGVTDHRSYPVTHLFAPLGIAAGVFEPDASGTLIGSSYVFLTARDWAKLGLLYLWDGVWKGVEWDRNPVPTSPIRLFPENWVRYSTTPTQAENADVDNIASEYGAHLWVALYKELKNPDANEKIEPAVPKDAFHFLGHDGQSVSIIPSKKLVIVRLGLTRVDDQGASLHFNLEKFLSKVIAATEE